MEEQGEAGRHAARRARHAGDGVKGARRQPKLPVRFHPSRLTVIAIRLEPDGDGEDDHQPEGDADEGAAHPLVQHRDRFQGRLFLFSR
jgi:hypothetical protein